MTEFELKLEIPPANLKSVAAAVLDGKVSRQRLQASYFDTADGALAAHGLVVRLRKEGRRWVQTAKGPTAELLERLEHNVALVSGPAGTMPTLDLSRHRGTPLGKAIDKALGHKTKAPYPRLDLLFGTDIQRITRRVVCGGSVVEVVLDQGHIFANGRSQSISEVEVELKEGVPHDAVLLARQWCARYGLWISTMAKSVKGQRLRSGTLFGVATSATAPQFERHASGHAMVTAAVAACLSQILPNMSELASGSKHPEHIHQLRVGIRRLRTALRELGGLTDAIDPAWESVLVHTFRALGAHRDYQQLAVVLQPRWLAAGGPDIHFIDAESNMPDPGDTVRMHDVQDVLLGLLSFVHSEPPPTTPSPDALCNAISERLNKLFVRALRDGKKFLAIDEAQQHRVRKRFKRLRYLAEFAAPLFSARRIHHMTTALNPVQDALGVYNDELMALHTLSQMVADDPRAWFGIGWLTARRERHAKRCLKVIQQFSQTKPFWTHPKN